MFSKAKIGGRHVLLIGFLVGLVMIGLNQHPDWALSARADGIPPRPTLADTSDTGPALALFNDQFYIAWTGAGNQFLNVMRSSDGITFDPATKVTLAGNEEETGIGLALVGFNDKLYIAWAGTDSEHHLNIKSSLDGVKFQDKQTFPDTTDVAPALTGGGLVGGAGGLWIAWTAKDGSISIRLSANGIDFGDKVPVPNETSIATAGPALTTYRGKLYIAWTGTNQHLNVMSSSDGIRFDAETKRTLPDDTTSTTAPALAVIQGRLVIAWTGTDGSLNIRSSVDGLDFGVKHVGGDIRRSFAAPALAEGRFSDATGILAWTQDDSEHHLNTASISSEG